MEVAELVSSAGDGMVLALVGVSVDIVGDVNGDIGGNPGFHDDNRVPCVANLERGAFENPEGEV